MGFVGAKKILVELEFFRLEFYHFISLLLPWVCSCFVFFFITPPSVLLQPNCPAGVLLHRSTQCFSPTRSPTQGLFVFRSSMGCSLLLRSFFFFGVFFLGSFFFFSVGTFFVLYLNSTIKNSRFMWHNHVQLSKLSKWEVSLLRLEIFYASLQFSFKPVLTYYILSLHNVILQISPNLAISMGNYKSNFSVVGSCGPKMGWDHGFEFRVMLKEAFEPILDSWKRPNSSLTCWDNIATIQRTRS